ncbi:acetyl-CoA carboxylase carboxyltransferase subunit alpha [Micromonospora sp. NPDC048835]|uniref:acetyl-CoA carboxylase carboxyltransferase subunit alpha n=1 Tax=Micromonospora sp. NPDC048835 TaxID=3155147 RepID=UPI0033E30BD5
MTATVNTPVGKSWLICPGCRALLYQRRVDRNLGVCPECDHHDQVTAHQRIEQLFDLDSVEELPPVGAVGDPLGFVDTKPYPQRIEAARRRTGLDEAVVCVRGTVEGQPLVAAVMDFRFLGGSLGSGVGERITRAAEVALETGTPLLIVSASGGARMQEGALSLMQMAKTSAALGALDEAGVLTISLVSDPTYGGVAASFATLCDVILAEPGARLGFAGPRVIQQTLRQPLPAGFQTAEYLFARGMLDDLVPRSNLRPTIGRLLAFAGAERSAPDPYRVRVAEPPEAADAWSVVALSRDLGRPSTLDYIGHFVDGFVELHGDRLAGDCPAIVGGVGLIDGRPAVVIGHQKGHTVAEVASRNFGMATPAGYRKAARLMRLAEKLATPIVTLIDTPGAYHGISAEENGQALAIADNIRLMAGLTVPVVAVVTGEGGSGGALALGVGNRVLMLANATYSVISPEGCAAILWNDSGRADEAAAQLKLQAGDLLTLGIVDGVVAEPPGGAPADPGATASAVHRAVVDALAELAGLNREEVRAHRRARFRQIGGVTNVGG